VTALENGEVNLISPQSSVDVLAALDLIENVTYVAEDEGTYEHVDVIFDNGGPFDPATYGGDEAQALAVRQAFLTCIPRQEIIDKLIIPLNPNAEIRQSYNVVPGAPNYDEVVAANGMAEAFGTGDPEAARAKSWKLLALTPQRRLTCGSSTPSPTSAGRTSTSSSLLPVVKPASTSLTKATRSGAAD
jgi:peptide/nickel transport system substrate-binding protein